MDSERKLFELRRTARLGQKDQLSQRVQQLQQQITGLTAQQDAKAKEIDLIEQELAGVRDLLAKEPGPAHPAYIAGARGGAAARRARPACCVRRRGQRQDCRTQLQILQVDQDFASDVAKQLSEVDSKIGEYVERKITAEDQLKRTDIRAPQDGVVFQSTANTVGGVITAGDPIMMIVPESDDLPVEVKVEPKDIDLVALGQPVVLRFSAFNQRTTPGTQRHRHARWGGYHDRSADRPKLLSGPHRDDRG